MPEGPGRQTLGAARNAMRKSISQNVGLVAKGPLRVSPLSTLVHLGDKEMDVMDKSLGKSDLTSWAKEEFGTGEKPYNAAYSDWKDNTLKPAPATHW
ncbi:hypothetical protein ACFV7R_23100 [Streptomyces sp. NPDC059866]|uniref:hypothetical protein n=1 Tax=Streptomyces sp. NPDC059866 TaxID=3346978 RepID=UPI003659CAED